MRFTKILSVLLATVMLLSVCITGISSADKKLPFTDTPEGEWYYDAVAYTYAAGLMNGTGDGTKFSPAMNLTRGMVVTVLYRNDGANANTSKNPFCDISGDEYYAAAAIWAYNVNVVTGTGYDDWGDPIFSPDRNITRQELAAMFARYAAYRHVDTTKNTTDITSFPDSSSVASWAEKEFKWTAGTGIITGKSNGGATTLAPTDLATRAEFAIMIQRYNVKDDAREFTYKLAYESPVVKSQYTEKEYPLVKDADVYVAVDGNDSNPGTLEKPLATFAAAKAKVQEIKKTKTSGKIVVAFKGGDYGVLDNIQLTTEDGGNANLNITYCAYGDGPVYFTNGVYLKADEFKPLSDSDKALFDDTAEKSILKLDLSSFANAGNISESSVLFNSSGIVTEARYPNKNGLVDMYIGGSVIKQFPADGHTEEEIMNAIQNGVTDAELKTLINQKSIYTLTGFKSRLDTYNPEYLSKGKLSGFISKVWHAETLPIDSYDKETGIITLEQSPNYGFVNYEDTVRNIFILGVCSDLDTDGEYWFNPETKTLYVYNPHGEYLFSTHDTFITARKIDNFTLRGLNFRGCTQDAIDVYTARSFTFDQGSIMYVGGRRGLYVDCVIDTKIINSEFAFNACTAVAVYGPTDDFPEYDPQSLESDRNVIDNNLIHDVAITDGGTGATGIEIVRAVKTAVTHNEVYNSSRAAINFRDGILMDISYNYFHHCMLNSADGGTIYTGRRISHRGTTIRYNLVADCYNPSGAHTGGTMGIYIDDSHANLIIEKNIFFNSGAGVLNNRGRDHVICDNLFICTRDGASGITGYADWLYDVSDYLLFVNGVGFSNSDEIWGNFKGNLPAKNSENGKKWFELWPDLYDILAIAEHADDPDFYKTTDLYKKPANVCHNNYVFGGEHYFDDLWVQYSDNKNNPELPLTENPFFADPTHGDYTITDTSKFADIQYDKIGRY
ncbi:MAG: S-layer homology domain-containing protein [Clostridia bacterium]|nr:S-layer homology domain-containing protein [Clostridia bacterium]